MKTLLLLSQICFGIGSLLLPFIQLYCGIKYMYVFDTSLLPSWFIVNSIVTFLLCFCTTYHNILFSCYTFLLIELIIIFVYDYSIFPNSIRNIVNYTITIECIQLLIIFYRQVHNNK